VLVVFANNRDHNFLYIAIPMLLALLVIPMVLTMLNRQVSSDVREYNTDKLKLEKIQNINLTRTGEPVKIVGTVEKISFRWMNRPLLNIKDKTGIIPVIVFTPFPEEIKVGDTIRVVGMIMRKFFLRGQPAISSISIEKISD
jgi:RecJ-like exonuclease